VTRVPRDSRDLWPAAVLFDLDGTLADSFAAIAAALNLALSERGLPEHDLEWTRGHVGRGAVELVRAAVAPAGEEAMRAVGASFARHYEAIYREQTPPLPGVAEVLALAAGRTGGRVGVVSNKYARLCRGWLEHWGLAAHVAVVAGPDTTGARKPDAGAVEPALAALGVAPADALLVGDMDIDAETGRNAGIAVVLVAGGATPMEALRVAGALAVLGGLRELPGWLAANGRGWR
jgi:phosphoglycolate phosphatase